MAADLRKMQENQWVSERRIDKLRFEFNVLGLNIHRSASL